MRRFLPLLGMGMVLLMGCAHSSIDRRKPAALEEESAPAAEITPCGVRGVLEKRVRDCSRFADSTKETFVLVTRTTDGHEVYWDHPSGLLWGDRLDKKLDHRAAVRACRDYAKIVGEIHGIHWRLPELELFQAAEKRGIGKLIPGMGAWHWSATGDESFTGHAWIYNGKAIEWAGVYLGSTDTDYRVNLYEVRCVGQ